MQPLISLPALERAFSQQRLAAYRLDTDRDESDGLARYLWNLALVSAIHPVLHTLEVAFRNEIARAAARLTQNRTFRHDRIPSWLDARPTMLMQHEAEKVERAKKELGHDRRSQTEGHLIAKLDFGFWVALCRDSYSDMRGDGPRLWDRALGHVCRQRPASVTTRAEIFHRFDGVRKFRNRVAHHEPIWDRGYLAQHEHILESVAWMHPKLAASVRQMSRARAAFDGGPGVYRPHAETLLGTGPGLGGMLESKLGNLSPERGPLVISLVDALVSAPAADTRTIVTAWAHEVAAN